MPLSRQDEEVEEVEEDIDMEDDEAEVEDYESDEVEEAVAAQPQAAAPRAPDQPAPAQPTAGGAGPSLPPRAMPSLPPRGMPSLPPRGMPSLPPRQTPSASTAAASTPASAAPTPAAPTPAAPTPAAPTPAAPTPAAPTPSAPTPAAPTPAAPAPAAPTPAPAARSTMPSLPPRQAPTPAAPTPAAPSGGPSLPQRPAAAPPAGGPSLPQRSAAAPPAGGPSLPQRPAAAPPAAAARPAAVPRPTAQAAAPTAGPLVPTAPPAPPPPSTEVVDPSEAAKVQTIQKKVQDLRVALLRGAGRLGLRYDSEQVSMFMQVIERVERTAGATIYKGTRNVDLNKAAERKARELDSEEPADSPLDVKIKIMMIGMTGTGKSELINSMLERPAARTNAFSATTKGIRTYKGLYHGIKLELIDTPGLHASSSCVTENKTLLRKIKRVYLRQKPSYVFYVDRLDAARPGLGELSLMSMMTQVFGVKMWRETMVVLTHTHAARQALGAGYDMFSRQRRNILAQLIRQAAGDAQVRNPMHLVDCHPNCPTNSFGQPVILEGGQNVPWKQSVFMQLVGYRVYEEVQNLFKEKLKGKGKAGAAKPDMFKQMMRARLPPVKFFVEQMAEGVLKPDTWPAHEDPFDQESDDEEAEEYAHMYYKQMYHLAKEGLPGAPKKYYKQMYHLAQEGLPGAQKEYILMLKQQKLNRLAYKSAYKTEELDSVNTSGYEQLLDRLAYKNAYETEEVDSVNTSGYDGYVTEGLDLGPSFDPDDATNYRYCYCVPESTWQIMPTLDYYGHEHEDAITGFVAEHMTFLGHKNGWGGVPVDVHLAVEKDKSSLCLQGETHLTFVHTVQPFGHRHISQPIGRRHISQACASMEMLRPNIKDVMYQLELNTFRDGLLRADDHAGFGVMVARLGEGGDIKKGPMGMGIRLQDNFRAGCFKINGAAARVRCDGPSGGKDEAWAARVWLHCDYLAGLGCLLDFTQELKQKATPQDYGVGICSTMSYDWLMNGVACSGKLDYSGPDDIHLDVTLFTGSDYKLGWLLVVPAWNYVKDMWQMWRSRGQEQEEFEEEEEEEGDDPAAGMDIEAMLAAMKKQGVKMG
eukprot:gene10149-8052_t